MVSEPLVSIIMPAYNAERYIAEAIQSVRAQTWHHWELIIVNDGSTDGTKAYLESLTDRRIRVIHQANQGVSVARNAALDVVRGEFITFLDADDILPPRSLAVRAKCLLADPGIGIVDGRISTRDENLNVELRDYRPYHEGKLLPRLLRLDSRAFFGPFYMARINSLAKIRFSVSMTHAEDLRFFIEAASACAIEYRYVTDLVYVYRKSSGSAMSNLNGLERGYLELIRAAKPLQGVSRVDHAILRLKIAKILFLSWWAAGERGRCVTAAMRAARA